MSSPSVGKYFVGGLNRVTTTESLRTHFEMYGPLSDYVVMQRDGVSRGFGFVQYTHPDDPVNSGMLANPHVIDGKQVEIKLAVPSESMPAAPRGGIKKLFIGGLAPTTTQEVLYAYFAQFGTLTDAVVIPHRETGKSRGFGFVEYATPEEADIAFSQQHIIEDRTIELKKAEPKPSGSTIGVGGGGGGGGRGGSTGSSGGYGGGHVYGGSPWQPVQQQLYTPPMQQPQYLPFQRGPPGPVRNTSRSLPPPPTASAVTGPPVTGITDSYEASTKVFIGGLNRATDEDSLGAYFSLFGTVVACEVMRTNGESRGFGFCVFATVDQARAALQCGPHTIDGKPVEVKPCIAKTPDPPQRRGGTPMGARGGGRAPGRWTPY